MFRQADFRASQPESPMRASVLAEAARLAILLRHVPSLIVAVVYLAVEPIRTPVGVIATTLVGIWSAWRLATRSRSWIWTALDLAVVQAFVLCTGTMIRSAEAAPGPSGPQSVAGLTIVSLAVETRAYMAFLGTGITYASLLYGYSYIAGLASPFSIFSVHFVWVQWALTVVVRELILRAATIADAALARLNETRVAQRVAAARTKYQAEQWRLLHDTAAGTLQFIGNSGDLVDAATVAEEARRDIRQIRQLPTGREEGSVDLVELIRKTCGNFGFETDLRCTERLPVPYFAGYVISAAAREALNNVERHAHATRVTIELESDGLTITDNGVGFTEDDQLIGSRFGIRESIIARLRDIGGEAEVRSKPGMGTTVRMSWPSDFESDDRLTSDYDSVLDADRLFRQLGYGIATVAITLTFIALMRIPSLRPVHAWSHIALLAVMMACTIAGLVNIRRPVLPSSPLVVVTVLISPLQSLFIPAHVILLNTNWAYGNYGWTLDVLLLRQRIRTAVATLAASWVLASLVILAISPKLETLADVGYLTAGVILMQSMALYFVRLLGTAVHRAQDLNDERARLLEEQEIRRVVQTDFARRYQTISDSIIPFLQELSDGTASAQDPAVRKKARVFNDRLRRIFAELNTYEHGLTQEIRHLTEDIDTEDTRMDLCILPGIPDLEPEACRQLVHPLRIMLEACTPATHLRITAIGDRGAVLLSMHAQCTFSAKTRQAAERLRTLPGCAVTITDEDKMLLRVESPS
ncbi:sensor histidine kinase [Nocardia amamiensis]|uniref:sensor histidine kinase n=1 Tax=Nocardia TaxID=1817 RepID=UPI00340AAD99